ncbi:MAG: GAF domain-containing protein [Chloroflexi bacterium]|nr:GAF domain-containing protein [Chloroflexota bacterium]
MDKNFSPSQPPNTESTAFNYKSWRNEFILIVLRIACVVGLALILFNWATTPASDRVLFTVLYASLLLVTILPAQYALRASVLLVMVFVVGANSILGWGPWLDGSVFFVACVALSSLLFDQRIDIFVLIASILTVTTIAILQQLGIHHLSGPGLPVTTSTDWGAYIVDFSLPSAILIIAIGQFKGAFTRVVSQMQTTLQTLTSERAQLEERVSERTEELNSQTVQLRTSTNVARVVAEIQDIPTLIETVTTQISEQFGFYHVGLYILDDQKKNAFLQAASSVNGKQLIGQGFRVEPDRRNAMSSVIQQNRPMLSSDTEDTNFVRDANFPLTRSRMILPLAVRGNVIGILDIHSDRSKAFTSQDSEIIRTLSDLIAISFDNVRLINETKNLLNQLEINTSYQANETWTKFTSRHKPGYQYTPAGVRPLFSTDKKTNGDGLRVPLTLYGQNIGTIKLIRKGGITEWSERERALVEKIADQVALALENSRLVDEAQKNALRDQMIANVSTRVRETLDVESVIRTATTELRKVFDLKEAEISIGTGETEPSPARKTTYPSHSK